MNTINSSKTLSFAFVLLIFSKLCELFWLIKATNTFSNLLGGVDSGVGLTFIPVSSTSIDANFK